MSVTTRLFDVSGVHAQELEPNVSTYFPGNWAVLSHECIALERIQHTQELKWKYAFLTHWQCEGSEPGVCKMGP